MMTKNVNLTSLEKIITRYVKATYLPERFRSRARTPDFTSQDVRFFLSGVVELSESFTSERADLSKNYFSRKEYRSAYLLYFFLTNVAKVWHCLAELDQLGQLPTADDVGILDVGAGQGTVAIACAQYFAEHHPSTKLTIHAVEQNREALTDAKNLFSKLSTDKHRLTTIEGHLTARSAAKVLRDKKFDLIFAANVLNELRSAEDQYALCKELLHHCTIAPLHGSLIIIDPALQRTTRNLMEVRDLLLERRDAQVIAPCLHQQTCPMRAANKRDWCHFYLEWECPKVIRDIDREIGNRHDYLKMAYYILQSGAAAAPLLVKAEQRLYRIVSSPMGTKGKTEILLCGDQGELKRMTEFDKNRDTKQLPFHGVKRGDIVTEGFDHIITFQDKD
ncbi:MAG: methyltransferase domain-containing protein [Deltaproteobacteria bacterium]|nr:methyltransferase domain-containing protein [Deltaproteobacteria bacterium]